ncbi:glycosyltransferase family 2 protein [Poseidonocella sp. HB161398]|uniref:glycosyltransferase family 2 protein n=1 Tax=Poseidonocella sp. HB161398 TaxID=2320855 RepID=UPI001109716E|nr:glycosyltransferase family 2 protein [Poseidonocella sp. HB161398]
MQTENVAAITMVYGDHFIGKWVDYYSEHLGEKNVFVISHGESDYHNKICRHVNHITLPRVIDAHHDKYRARLLSDFANAILQTHACVLVLDADEIISVEPSLNISLKDYLLQKRSGAAAPLGFNIFQPDPSSNMDWDSSVLRQAHIMLYRAAFSKPAIRWESAQQSVGCHALLNRKFSIDENLFLFHMKFSDAAAMQQFDELAAELDGISNKSESLMHHWFSGSDFVKNRVKEWSNVSYQEKSPQEGAKGHYRLDEFGERGAIVKQLGKPIAFSIPEAYRGIF